VVTTSSIYSSYNHKRPVHYLKSRQDRHGSVIYEIRLNFIRLNKDLD
jgi:hypothetical protein